MTILFIATYIVFAFFIAIIISKMAALGDDTAKELADYIASINRFAFTLLFLVLPILAALAMAYAKIDDFMEKRCKMRENQSYLAARIFATQEMLISAKKNGDIAGEIQFSYMLRKLKSQVKDEINYRG